VDNWAYGLIELEKKRNKQQSDKNSDNYEFKKELTLCEIYFDEKHKPIMYAPVKWSELKNKSEKYYVINDIFRQLESNIKIYAKKNKKGGWKIWQQMRM